MNRFRNAEKMAAATRRELPAAALAWTAAVREPLERLTRAALDPEMTDERFLELVREFSDSLPELMESMDHDALARLMETGMGAAMANGIDARLQDARRKSS